MAELLNMIVGAIIGFQIAYAVCVLFLGEIMLKYYEWGYFEEAKHHWYLKIPNAFLITFMGFGYWAGKRVNGYNLFKRSILLMGYILLFIIASIIVYMLLSRIFLWLEDLFIDELYELIVR